MNDTPSPQLTTEELDRLQRLRASVIAFQNMIAPLPATERNDNHNEQFNQLRLEAKILLKSPQLDRQVSPVTTMNTLVERQKSTLPRLYGVVIFGMILALFGLGFNSIFVDMLSTAVGCLVSSSGMFLIMGAFVMWGLATNQRRTSNLGEVYQRCETLLYQIDHTLNMAIPELANRPPATETPSTPSVVALALDALNKQAADWQQKLQALEEQQTLLDPNVPLKLKLDIDFVRRELARVEQEIARLYGQPEATAAAASRPAPVVAPPASSDTVQEIPLPGGRKIAVSKVSDTEAQPAASPSPSPPPPATEPADSPSAAFIDTRKMKPVSQSKPPVERPLAKVDDVSPETAAETAPPSSPAETTAEQTDSPSTNSQQKVDTSPVKVVKPAKKSPTADSDAETPSEEKSDLPINQAQTIAMPLGGSTSPDPETLPATAKTHSPAEKLDEATDTDEDEAKAVESTSVTKSSTDKSPSTADK